jgi:FeS assembly protein IscX
VDRRGRRHRALRRISGLDPLTIRFTDLRERVLGLDGFDDDPQVVE